MIADATVPPAIAVLSDALGDAHPASDGAHRLGWWLALRGEIETDTARLARAAGSSPEWIERLLSGEVEPEGLEAEAIAQVTRSAVQPGDWRRGGPLRWRERPVRRQAG